MARKKLRTTEVSPIEARTTLLSMNADGTDGFVSCKRRVNKKTLRHSSSVDLITQIGECAKPAALELDIHDCGTPQYMRTSPDGRSVAFIRTLYGNTHGGNLNNETPHSAAFVWTVACDLDNEQASAATQTATRVDVPVDAEEVGAINAQDVWWVDDGRLVVLWSTAFVHPMGSVIGANADAAGYAISVSTIAKRAPCAHSEHSEHLELDTVVGPFPGKAKMASPSSNGHEVAILVRKPPVGNGPASLAVRTTMLHNIFSESVHEIEHVVKSHHPLDRTTCPSSIGLSPAGDCLVAVHCTQYSVFVEVLTRTTPSVFVSVQNIDVTHWVKTYDPEPGIATVMWEPVPDFMRLPYTVTFSPCGRFAVLIDKRTMFNLKAPNHALLVLDTALRGSTRGVRARPLAPLGEIAPRSIEWTPSGLFVQSFHGAVRLSTE